MNHAVSEHSSVVPFRTRKSPGPVELPGIEGFYVLTADGILGRYEADGRFCEDHGLTRTLSSKIDTVLGVYRTGEVDQLALGLVTPSTPDQPWRSASFVFSNAALREVYKTDNQSDAPLTTFQKRNKVKSVYQGLELVLDTKKPSQPQHPRFCPFLFAPEVSSEMLCRRYGMAAVDRRKVLEVLDLMSGFSPEEQRHPALSGMVVEMLQAKIAPELRDSPALSVVENVNVPETGGLSLMENDLGRSPWQDQPDERGTYISDDERNTCFSDGDPVTYWLLAWFAPFNELNDLQRQFIARGHTISRKRAGTTLVERGSRDDVTFYLLEGTLELEAYDGKTMTIVGGTRRAHLPVSQLRPHAYTVRAATDVTLVVVSQDMVREITRIATTYKSRPGIEISEEESLPETVAAWVAYEPETQQS